MTKLRRGPDFYLLKKKKKLGKGPGIIFKLWDILKKVAMTLFVKDVAQVLIYVWVYLLLSSTPESPIFIKTYVSVDILQ